MARSPGPEEAIPGGERILGPLLETEEEPIVLLDSQARVAAWTAGARRLVGRGDEEVVGADFSALLAGDGDAEGEVARVIESARESGRAEASVELSGRDGERVPTLVDVTALRPDGGEPLGYSAKLRRRFADEDSVRGPLDESLFRELAVNANTPIVIIDDDDHIRFANPASERVFGYGRQELLDQPITMLMTAEERERHAEERERYLAEGAQPTGWTVRDFTAVAKDGTEIPVEVSYGSCDHDGERFYAAVVTDLRERNRLAMEAERRFTFLARAGMELASSLDYTNTLETLAHLAVPDFADYASIDQIAETGEPRRLVVHHRDPAKIELIHRLREKFPIGTEDRGPGRVIRTGETEYIPDTEALLREAADNEEHLALLREIGLTSLISAPLIAHGRTLGVITLAYADSGRHYDEADRKMVESLASRAAMAIHNAQVVRDLEEAREELERQKWELERTGEDLREANRRLDLHLEQTPLGAIDSDTDARIVSWNPSAERIFGFTADQAIGMPVFFLVHEEERERAESMFGALMRREKGAIRTITRGRRKDGETIHCEWYATGLVDSEGNVIGVGLLVEDITERREAEEQSQKQVEQLNALRSIDLAITASLDLRVTLSVLLDQVVSQLGVDAADILLLNPFTQRLEFTTGRGFRTSGIQATNLLLGECSAGRAALERRTISVSNLPSSKQFTRADLIAGEDFVAHFCTPLVSKGKVTGVLEVFSRASVNAEPEWIGFLEALAAQAAIAVDSARLFEDLQQTNLELVLAYDTTLEGWARALDLRDNVTEGHSRRVTEMTVRLARLAGIEDDELVNIRRGALLHDIGKIGIPDQILHKDGPLTEQEWEVMKKHPQYAYDLLYPIEFLRPALDIPYAHHEHWDGSGYPRGLKGEDIPIAARLFAVVDVWDALNSDRSYNLAWPEDRIREHIRDLAGTHLDPGVVEIFLSVDW